MKKFNKSKLFFFIFYLVILSIITYIYPLYKNYPSADKLYIFLVFTIFVSSIVCTFIFINNSIKISLIGILTSNIIITYIGNKVFNIFLFNNLYFAVEDQDIWAWEDGTLLISIIVCTLFSFLLCIALRYIIKLIKYIFKFIMKK